jgi:hypothetical protein
MFTPDDTSEYRPPNNNCDLMCDCLIADNCELLHWWGDDDIAECLVCNRLKDTSEFIESFQLMRIKVDLIITLNGVIDDKVIDTVTNMCIETKTTGLGGIWSIYYRLTLKR